MIPFKLDTSSPMVTGDSPEKVRQKLAMDEVRRNLESGGKDDSKLKEASQGFETIFISKLWEQMRQSVPKEGYLHSREEDMYLSMFDRELAQKMSESGGIGLGQMLYDELKDQLQAKARGVRTRTVNAPAEGPNNGKGLPLNPEEKTEAEAKPVDKQRALALEQAERVLREMRTRRLGPAETSQASLEPDFNPLADTDPNVRAAASAPPEIMNRAMNLAARIEMGRTRAEAVEQGAKTDSSSGQLSSLTWPMQGDVVTKFGWKTEASGERVWRSGIEIAATDGESVQAGWDGTVSYAGPRGDQGWTIVLDHPGGWRTVYGQVGKSMVSTGDRVTAGSKIAEMDETGKEGQARLYFEIRKGAQAWNPEAVRERLQADASAPENI